MYVKRGRLGGIESIIVELWGLNFFVEIKNVLLEILLVIDLCVGGSLVVYKLWKMEEG